MKKIGLDFGMTNSIICYLDGGKLLPWQLGGTGGDNSIPSMLSIHREDGITGIGRAARAKLGNDDYHVYLGFKMLLGVDNPERLAVRGYRDFTPREAAAAYLRELVQSYQREQGVQELEGVVLTVPEIWVNEGRSRAREELENLCQEIDLPILQLLSEPVAATVYFLHAFQQRESEAFNGHTLVCDYGGGTLDLSLCKVEGNDITVLERSGSGHADPSSGRAGLAFDEAVVRHLLSRAGRSPEHNGRGFRGLMEFEEKKINKRDAIAKTFALYLQNSKANKPLFQVDGLEVQCSDLAEVFETLIKPELRRSLEDMRAHILAYQIDIRDADNFRILLVGGFSAFYLVQHTVRDFFGSRTQQDSRFQTAMSLTDTTLAIAKGAALVAQETVRLAPKSKHLINKPNSLFQPPSTISPNRELEPKLESEPKPRLSPKSITEEDKQGLVLTQKYRLVGHSDWVNSVSFSPDGKRLASGSHDHSVILWDAEKGDQMANLNGHPRGVSSVSFSRNGKTLASAGGRTLILWDAATGERIMTLEGYSGTVTSLSFSPDNKWLASASDDRTVILWEIATGKKFKTVKKHTRGVNSVAFSPDGKTLASGSDDRSLILWDIVTGKEITSLQGHSDGVLVVAFSPDGKRLASGSDDRTIIIWEVATGKEITTLRGYTRGVTSVSFSPDGKTLASGSMNAAVILSDVATGDRIGTLEGHSGTVTSVSFGPNGERLASGSRDKTVILWESLSSRRKDEVASSSE